MLSLENLVTNNFVALPSKVKHAQRGAYTTKLLHEIKLETELHKLFGEIFGRVYWNDLENFEMFRV